MRDWMWFLALLVIYIAATQWLLPKLGIRT